VTWLNAIIPGAESIQTRLFFDMNGPLMLVFKDPDKIIKRKHPGMLTRGVIVSHDSAPPHVPTVQDKLHSMHRKVLNSPI
jgi:hypothetical protein